ncbi:MAG TPA: TIR domain-containing protein [Ktedonobacteraceae bacterium]|nr:TIR domain-containing protein [Ktedonobacteraceae bacterium]
MIVTSSAPVQAFYCFDPVDLAYVSSLDLHLAPLKHAGRLQTWGEWQVLAGSEWERERNRHFSTARLLLLLLSPDFLASEMGQQQIQMALQRRQAEDAVVLPLLLRPCAWEETELRSLQILPGDHEALILQPSMDKAWQEIVVEISHVLETLQKRIYLVFVPEDQDIVEHLSEDLSRSGVTVCRLKGDPFSSDLRLHKIVHEAIRQASCVLLMASPTAFSSRIVKAQMELANDYQRSLYVLWVRGEDVAPLHSGPWQAEVVLDARDQQCYETATTRLLSHFRQPRAATPVIESLLITEPRNPYKGLHAFTAQDTRDFFGRDTLIDELATALEQILVQEKKEKQHACLLTVLGASGSGKTSVVLAGLLPQLQQGGVFNSQEWIYLDPIVPGIHPLEALAVSFARQPALEGVASLYAAFASDSLRTLHLLALQLAGSSACKVVLFIDQFEEVFTLTSSEEERMHFFDLLITALTEPRGALLVILALRMDFYERATQYPVLYRLLDAHRVSVLPMERDDLRRVIEEPAHLPDVQMTFESDLVGDLLFDMREQAGALPLLEFTLDLLFAHRNGQMLTLRAYHEIGGVKGALARHAEATYDALPTKEHQALARSLFLRLIDPGRSEQNTTRRRAKLTEFEQLDLAQTKLLRETIDAFVAARLLTTNEQVGEATLEVSHEALIREWQRLIEWLSEAREDILLQQKISEDAAEWQQRLRPQDRLYRGSQLKEARAWAKRNTPSQLERTFLHFSMKQRVQFVASMIGVMLLLFATTGAAIYFFIQRPPDPTEVTTLQNDGVGSLRWAIDNALSGKTITFASSLAGQTITLTDTLVFPNKQLHIQGPDERRITIRNATNEIVVNNQTSITLINLTFLGGPNNSTFLFSNQGALTLSNSAVSDNGSGGIDNVANGVMTLTNSTVSGNEDNGGGGGGISNYGTITLTNSIISDNMSNSSDAGGIDNDGGTITLTNSIISDNMSRDGGGGISNNNGAITLTDSIISANMSNSSGAGILNYGSVTLTNSTVSGNEDNGGDGGGISNNNGTITLTNSTVSGNTSDGFGIFGGGGGVFISGGGIFNEGGTVTLMNSTVSDNTAGGGSSIFSGGGIFNEGGRVTLVFCTLYGNQANTGGGLFTQALDNFDPGVSIIRNSLVAGNRASTDPDIAGNLTTEGHNLIQSTAGTIFLDPDHQHRTDLTDIPLSNISIDPHLQLNGKATTKTHALLPDSPAIDAIPLTACLIVVNSIAITTDQRGVKRPQGSACDIGAYEYTP